MKIISVTTFAGIMLALFVIYWLDPLPSGIPVFVIVMCVGLFNGFVQAALWIKKALEGHRK